MSTTFDDVGLTVADVQSVISTYLHCTIVLIFCHGIHTCVFSAAIYYIAESSQPKQKRITLASIVAFLWCTNTIIVAVEWHFVEGVFISHGESLKNEFTYYLYGDLSEVLAVSILRSLNTILADLILIWRCWVIYDKRLVVIAAPSLCLVTETISICLLIAVYVHPVIGANQVNWSLVYYSTTVVTNSLCTFLILFRIVRVSGLGASLKTYRGIIEILVESAAMYAAIYIALLVVYTYEFYSPSVVVMTAYAYPQAISGIAPTLIIARVMAGHSRPDYSWTRPSLPHLRTPMRSIAESLRFASAPADHSTGTQRTIEDNDVEQARDGEAEASESASGDERTEGKSSGVKIEAMNR